MADTHEEQLLNRLLRDISREDASLDAAHLEARVLESASLPSKSSSSRVPVWMALPVAAALLLAVATLLRPKPEAATSDNRSDAPTSATEIVVLPPAGETAQRQPTRPRVVSRGERKPRPANPTPVETADAPHVSFPIVEAPVPDMPIEFVPLMPIAEQELSGPFQIVRVQMPGASLGPLRSPAARPDDIVEADVLLGEDGRARAIRVNSNVSGSIYPWRPK